MSGFRLATGGSAIDRARPIAFQFDGRPLNGVAGDTLASALIANGISTVGRSFKYHRRRGILTAGAAETNALVQLGTGGLSTPNVPAPLVLLTNGLVARPVNCWPSASFDIAAVNGLFAPVLTAGFYYKTFMRPSWHMFEGFIRRAAGLGTAPDVADPDLYGIRHASVDRLVIGATKAGRAVAQGATDRCLLIDPAAITGANILGRTTAIAALDHGLILAVETPIHGVRERLWLIRANDIVIASEPQEQPLVFARNDLPGILLASAVAEYVGAFGVAPGRRILLAGVGDLSPLAAVLRAAGVTVAGDVRYDAGNIVLSAYGRRHVTGADIMLANGSVERITCDCIAMSGGFAPSLQLLLQAGGTLARDEGGYIRVAAATGGIRAVEGVGMAAAGAIPRAILQSRKLAKGSFIDFQTDVTVADVQQAVDENYATPDHLKRYTVLGMGVDQGKLSGMNGAAALAQIAGRPLAQAFPTKARPPLIPTAFATLGAGKPSGELMRPRRYLPAHDFHVSRGAVFEDYGWERPSHYPLGGETLAQAAQREARAVRTTAGLFDGSPLGKIEVRGTDAGQFLDHIYVSTMSSLKPGRIRYGMMLTENGTIFDDGVAMRLADDRYLLNCTSGHAGRVFNWIDEHHQCEWPYDLVLQDVTTAWSTFALAGPAARAILQAVTTGVDLTAHAFPHLTHRTGAVGGISARIARVSFSGEVCFEVSVLAADAMRLTDALWQAGQPFGLTPYGIEALEILRVEKGYIHVGSDTDSETQPGDIGFGAAWPKKAADFIGRRSLLRANAKRENRKQLVGIVADASETVLPMGAHLVDSDRRSVGWIGSSYASPSLNRGVALALLEDGQAQHGGRVKVFSMGQEWSATVTSPCAFDPQNERLNG